jgi:hypothetical protein
VDLHPTSFEFEKLLEYGIFRDDDGWKTKRIVTNENGVLNLELTLRRKTEDENFKDIKHAITSYRNILRIFIIAEVIPQPQTPEQNQALTGMINDSENRADVLEFFLMNNTNIPKPNQKQYYNGRLELDCLRLIQELYFLALTTDNKDFKWLLTFNSPYELWYILQCQIIFLTPLFYSDIDFLKLAKYQVEESRDILKSAFSNLREKKLLSITEAIKYTIAKIYIEKTSPQISHLYTNYLESIRAQAYKARKGKLKMIRW